MPARGVSAACSVLVRHSDCSTPDPGLDLRATCGVGSSEPDFRFRRSIAQSTAKLALEYNGAQHAQVDRMRRDITRTLTVIGGDWLTVAFGPAEVFGRPHSLAPYVRSLLDRRAPGWWRREPL